MSTAWTRVRIGAAVGLLAVALTARTASGSVPRRPDRDKPTPVASYHLVGRGTEAMHSGSWAYDLTNRAPITITADPLMIRPSLTTVALTFTANITNAAAGGPGAGVPVTFTVALPSGGTLACGATTDEHGMARCVSRPVASSVLMMIGIYVIDAWQSPNYFGAAMIGQIARG